MKWLQACFCMPNTHIYTHMHVPKHHISACKTNINLHCKCHQFLCIFEFEGKILYLIQSSQSSQCKLIFSNTLVIQACMQKITFLFSKTERKSGTKGFFFEKMDLTPLKMVKTTWLSQSCQFF